MFEILEGCACFEVRLPGFLSQGPSLLLWDTSLSFPICEMGAAITVGLSTEAAHGRCLAEVSSGPTSCLRLRVSWVFPVPVWLPSLHLWLLWEKMVALSEQKLGSK